MVPSWTETLVACGVDVVGRTRYCVHPETNQAIPIVGGTKDWKIDLVRELNPDFILLDQEENPKQMFGDWPEKCVVTHVESVEDVSVETQKLSKIFKNEDLNKLAQRWQKVAGVPMTARDLSVLPSVLKWLRPPQSEIDQVVYVIWKDPWMAVSPDTFIGSVLSHLGFGEKIRPAIKKYYEFEIKDLMPKSCILFSSEPYPFLKKQEGLDKIGACSAIVNGEDYSWFGLRSLKFLELHKTLKPS